MPKGIARQQTGTENRDYGSAEMDTFKLTMIVVGVAFCAMLTAFLYLMTMSPS